MKGFMNYLERSKNILKSVCNCTKYTFHVVLGNESCDLDSSISSLAYGYFLHEHYHKSDPNSFVISVMNVTKDHFLLRTEVCHVLKQLKIDLDKLIYRNELNFDEIKKNAKIRTYLVDHHVLASKDASLMSSVVEIFDHRPINHKWASTVKTRIEPVGSCCTLVADEILKLNKSILCKEIASLLYDTIVYDTIALLPEHGKAKDLDISIAEQLEKEFNFTENRQKHFDRLWEAHNDVSHLTPKQLLFKDLKYVETMPIPGLPMLVEDFLKLPGATDAVKQFSEEHNNSLVVLIGLKANNGVQRDVGIYAINKQKSVKDTVLNKLHLKDQGYDFEFVEQSTGHVNFHVLRQSNTKLSRKQIIPILKEVVNECRREQM